MSSIWAPARKQHGWSGSECIGDLALIEEPVLTGRGGRWEHRSLNLRSSKEAHLLPAKHLSAWITNNVYLPLDETPFDRKDATLNPGAGACSACPRRSGYNTSLFFDVVADQCKLCGIRATASIFRWLAAAYPA